MPCRDPDWNESDRRWAWDTDTVCELEAKLDKVTALLCNICRRVKDWTVLSPKHLELSAEETEWYAEHEAADNARIVEEATQQREIYLQSVRDRLMKQLTNDELEALGI